MIDFFRLRDIREDNDINQIRMAEILGVNVLPIHFGNLVLILYR